MEKWKEKYKNGERTSAYSLIKELTSIKRKQFPWMGRIGKTSPQYAIHNLEKAYKNFFGKRANYPKFKKKGIKDSFVAVENKQSFKQKDKRIWIPRLGLVKCAENLRFDGKVNNVVVKRIADIWFACINIETNDTPNISKSQTILGVDLGIKYLAVISDCAYFKNPKALERNLRLLKRRQQSLCRKKKGSNNRGKAQMKIARLYYKISCIRRNSLHEVSRYIVNNANKIVLEDLNVKGMIKNKKLSRSLNDVSFGELRRQIQYKANWEGKEVIVADRFFPSSKTCCICGAIKENLKLSTRIYKCDCGNNICRDLNSAINLANYGITQKSWESKASGVGSSFDFQSSLTMKEEMFLFKNKET